MAGKKSLKEELQDSFFVSFENTSDKEIKKSRTRKTSKKKNELSSKIGNKNNNNNLAYNSLYFEEIFQISQHFELNWFRAANLQTVDDVTMSIIYSWCRRANTVRTSYSPVPEYFRAQISQFKIAKDSSEKYIQYVKNIISPIRNSTAYFLSFKFNESGRRIIDYFVNHDPENLILLLKTDASLNRQAEEFLKLILKEDAILDKYFLDILYLWYYLAQKNGKGSTEIVKLLEVCINPSHLLLNWSNKYQKISEIVYFYKYFPTLTRPYQFIRLYSLSLYINQFNTHENEEIRSQIWKDFVPKMPSQLSSYYKIYFFDFSDFCGDYQRHTSVFGSFTFLQDEVGDILETYSVQKDILDLLKLETIISNFDFSYLPPSCVNNLLKLFKTSNFEKKVKFLNFIISKFGTEISLLFFDSFISDSKVSEERLINENFQYLITEYPEKISLVVENSKIRNYSIEDLQLMFISRILYKKTIKILNCFWNENNRDIINFRYLTDYQLFIEFIEKIHLVFPLSNDQVKLLIEMVLAFYRVKQPKSFTDLYTKLVSLFSQSNYLLQYNIDGDYHSFDQKYTTTLFYQEKTNRDIFVRMFENVPIFPDCSFSSYIWSKLIVSNILTEGDRNSITNTIELWNSKFLPDYSIRFPGDEQLTNFTKSKYAFLINYIISKFSDLPYYHFPSCNNFLRLFSRLKLKEGDIVLYSSVVAVIKKYQELFLEMSSGKFTKNKYIDLSKHQQYFTEISEILEINIPQPKLEKEFELVEKQIQQIKAALSWIFNNVELIEETNTFNILKTKSDKQNLTYDELENTLFEFRDLGDKVFGKGIQGNINSEIAYYFLSQDSLLFKGIMKDALSKIDKRDEITVNKIGVWIESTISILKSLMKQEVNPNHIERIIKLLSSIEFDKELQIVKNCPFGFQEINADENTFSQILASIKIHNIVQMWDDIVELLESLHIIRISEDYIAISNLFQQFDRNVIHLKLVDQYKELNSLFDGISSKHLKLFQIFRRSVGIINFMKENKFHDNGGEKFNDIKDKINVGREGYRNDQLNSAIIAHRITAPFCNENIEFRAFINEVKMLHLTDSDLSSIEKINDHIEELSILFRSAVAPTLDVAIDKCRRIISSGEITIFANKLAKQRTTFHIKYTFNENLNSNAFFIEEDDVLELKRQVAYWRHSDEANVLSSFEEIHDLIEKIMKIVKELEDIGHPQFQLMELEKMKLEYNVLRDYEKQYGSQLSNWKQNYTIHCNHYLKIISPLEFSIVILLLSQNNEKRKTILDKLTNIVWSSENEIRNEQIISQSTNYIIHVLQVVAQLIPYKQNIDIAEIIKNQFNNNWILVDIQAIFNKVIEIFNAIFQPLPVIPKNQNLAGRQYLVSTIGNENINFVAVLFKIFENTRPAISQILFCSSKTSLHDLLHFFDLVVLFTDKKFVLLNIDLLTYDLRKFTFEMLKNLHDELTPFCEIFVCNTKSDMYYPWLDKKEFTKAELSDVSIAPMHPNFVRPTVKIVSSTKTGNGKTHFINKSISPNHIVISINDFLDVNMIIKKLSTHIDQDIYFKLSFNLNFPEIDLFFFKFLMCGSCRDESGNCYSLSNRQFKCYIENPVPNLILGTNLVTLSKRELNCDEIDLPIGGGYNFDITDKERRVAKILNQDDNNGSINKMCVELPDGTTIPVNFPEVSDYQCAVILYRYFAKVGISQKAHQKLFVNYLDKRLKFFSSTLYTLNMQYDFLGKTFLDQMILESSQFLQIDLRIDPNKQYETPIIVFDPSGTPILLHDDFKGVDFKLKELTRDGEQMLQECKETRWIKLLAWNFDVDPHIVNSEITKMGFVLTKEYAFKLIQIHERKLTRVPIVIEGETGVGKTFLFKFYANLMFSSLKFVRGQYYERIIPRTHSLLCQWFISIFRNSQKYKIPDDFIQNFTLDLFIATLASGNSEINFLDLWTQLLSHEENVKAELIKDPEYEPLYESLRLMITTWKSEYPMLKFPKEMKRLFTIDSLSIDDAVSILQNFQNATYRKVFYRILIHPGVTPQELEDFLIPIINLSKQISDGDDKIEYIIFFDEVNTGNCLGTIKEIFIDRTLNGITIPEELFLVAAINPARSEAKDIKNTLSHRSHYLVNELPVSFQEYKWYFGAMPMNLLCDYISKKLDFLHSEIELTVGPKNRLMNMIKNAHKFYTEKFGANSVSQREIQRLFKILPFLKRFSEKQEKEEFSGIVQYNCFIVAIALVYYLRLDLDTRVFFAAEMDDSLDNMAPEFDNICNQYIDKFVTRDNFEIPDGIALNRALKENIFAIVIAFECNIPLGIIGLPGSSKTLSYQIVYRNLKSRHSPKEFCKFFHAIDPFIYLCSEYSTEDDISTTLNRSIQREANYRLNNTKTKCLTFIDEASLPSKKKNVMKVLHNYLDKGKVSFIAIANDSFDPANQNRMMVVVRSVAELKDLIVLAKGCLGIQDFDNFEQKSIIRGICKGFLKITNDIQFQKYFHYRDLICTFRFLANKVRGQILKFDVSENSLLQAMEFNMNGVPRNEFYKILEMMYQSIAEEAFYQFAIPQDNIRNPLEILRESISTDTSAYPINLRPRYKMIIDGSDNNSILEYLLENEFDKIKHLKDKRIMTVSELPDDKNDIHSAEIVSAFKSAMEQSSLVILVNGKRVYGSLYDFFNQNLTVLSTVDNKSYANVAIGPSTYVSYVNPGFVCIVYIKESDLKKTPTPFLSRFEKFRITNTDLLENEMVNLSPSERETINLLSQRCSEFVSVFGQYHFCGFNHQTLETLILSHFHKKKFYKYSYINSNSRDDIEHNGTNNHFYIRSFCARLLQILSPEVFMKKLNSLENTPLYKKIYYHHQNHFHLEGLINRLLTLNNNIIFINENEDTLPIPTKYQIYCRAPREITIERSKTINFDMIRKKSQLEKELIDFTQDENKLLILNINSAHITREQFLLVQSTVDFFDREIRLENKEKYFILLIQFKDIYRNNFPPNFLNGWDSFYIECSSPFEYSLLRLISESLGEEENNFENTEDAIQNLFITEDLKFNVLKTFCHNLELEYSVSQFEQAFEDIPETLDDVREFYNPEGTPGSRYNHLEKIFTHYSIISELITKEFFTKRINRKNLQKLLDDITAQLMKDCTIGFASQVAHKIRAEFNCFILSFLHYLVNDFNLYSIINLLTSQIPLDLFKLLFRILVRDYKNNVQYHQKNTRYSINFNLETMYKIPKFGRIDQYFVNTFTKYKSKNNLEESAKEFQNFIISNKKSPIYRLVNYLQEHKEESKIFNFLYAYDFLAKKCQASFNDTPSKYTCEFLVNWIFMGQTEDTADIIQIYHKTRNFDKELRDLFFGSRCYIELKREIDRDILNIAEDENPTLFRNQYYSNLFDGLWTSSKI